MRSSKLLILTVAVFAGSLCAVAADDRPLQRFRSLTGREKVATIFNERLHGRSLLFWKRSAEVWRTAADARLAFEEEILVVAPDPQINDALAAEIRSPNRERARYAIFLACLRARFIPHSDFPVSQAIGAYSDGLHTGDISPFRPDLDKLGIDASQALRTALGSPDPKIRTTAQLYTFTLLDEISTVPTTELAARWIQQLKRLPCFSYTPLAFSEPEQSVFLIERVLASRGLEAVVAISSMLKIERDPELRDREIEMLRFLDGAAVRLRTSPEGREAIAIVERAWALDRRYCGQRLYTDEASRQQSWRLLEDQLLRDKFETGLSSWATLIAVALDEQFGDNLSVQFEKNSRRAGPQMQNFLSVLTDADPTFPAFEFPSTATVADGLHPEFTSKIRRYHEIWMKKRPHP